jgi:eukaryotic-like serine/threonine-protein kinase
MALTSGTKLGPYEIQSPLGAGGIGEVYRARDTRLERIVAIKILPAAFASDANRLSRFQQEARVLSALNIPIFSPYLMLGNQDSSYYLVCELLEGETLRERLNGGPLALRKAVDYGVQMANGLGAAHEKGIVHRDLKPDNIFITKNGRVKILDFGLAKSTTTAGGGFIDTARFTPDVQSVIYGAARNNEPFEIFSTRLEGLESRPFGLPVRNVLGIASNGQMALGLGAV